jgi:L-malate glycosyltransferase
VIDVTDEGIIYFSMRVLVVIYEFPPIGGGGGQAAQDICLQLVKRGHQVQVLTSHFKGLPYLEDQDGLLVRRVPTARQKAYQANLIDMSGFVLSGTWAGLKLIRDWQPDLMHVHFAVPSGPVALALYRMTGVPYILTAHLGDVPGGVPEKTDHWFRWIYRLTPPIWHNAKRVVAVSHFTKSIALQHYPRDIQVIPNGIDLDCLDPGDIRVGQPPRILFVGRFVQQKNPLQVVHTLAGLKHLGWECAMLGDGPLWPAVKKEIQTLGMEDRFILPGWLNHDEIVHWFSHSDILFMPSYTEGLPIAGLTALSMGLAIVASAVGGFVELVDNEKNGHLFDAYQPDLYQSALAELLSDTQRLLEFRRASRQKACIFDINTVAEDYEKLYFEFDSQPKRGDA